MSGPLLGEGGNEPTRPIASTVINSTTDEYRMSSNPESVIEQLQNAMNSQDLKGILDCFDPDYHSGQPVHPEREFRGKTHVRENREPVAGELRRFFAPGEEGNES